MSSLARSVLCSLLVPAGFLIACGESPQPKGKPDTNEPEQNADKKKDDEKSGATCGDGKCDPGETCQSCSQDCTCSICAEAKACSLGASAPGTFAPTTKSYSITFEEVSKAQILARLEEAVTRGDPGMALIAQALRAPEAGEHPVVARLRQHFAAHPKAESAIRRQLARPELAKALTLQVRPSAGTLINASDNELVKTPLPQRETTSTFISATDAGVSQCDAPQLRLRVGSIKVYKTEDDIADDIVYCGIATESPAGSHFSITPPTPNLGKKETHRFAGQDSTKATFWGAKEAKDPGGDLTIHYDCFEQDANNGYQDFVNGTADILKETGAVQDDGGWESTSTNLASKYLPSILALDGDDHLLSATQTIPRADQVALLNGATWEVRQKGTHNFSDWDWGLNIEAWGCAANGTTK